MILELDIRFYLRLEVGEVASCVLKVLVELSAQVQVLRVSFEGLLKELRLLLLVYRKFTLQLKEFV